MPLLLKTHKAQTFRPMRPKDTTTFVMSEEQHQTDDGGQIVIAEQEARADTLGERITPESRLAYSEVDGATVHVGNCYRCAWCRRICSAPTIRKRASRRALEEDPRNAIPHEIPVLGYCEACWARRKTRVNYYGRAFVRFLGDIGGFFLDPIRALADGASKDEDRSIVVEIVQPPQSAQPRRVANRAPLPPRPEQPPASQSAGPPPEAAPAERAPSEKPKSHAPAAAAILLVCLSAIAAAGCPTFTCPTAAPTEEAIAMPKSDPRAEMLAATAQLLQDATKLGLDMPHADPVARGMFIVLKNCLAAGEIDTLRLRILAQCIEKRKLEVRECVMLFDAPPLPEIANGDMAFLKTYPAGVPVLLPHDIFRLGASVSSNTGQGKSTLLYRMAESWLGLRLPVLIVALKPDGFFSGLSRAFPDRLLWLKVAADRCYNPLASVSGNALEYLRKKIEHWCSCYQKFDSAAVIMRVFEAFAKEQHLHRLTAPTLPWLLRRLETINLPKHLFNPALRASAYATLDLMNHGPLACPMASSEQLAWKVAMEQALGVLIDCHGLSDADYHFYVACLLADLRAIRHANPGLPPLLFLVDEADALISKRWDSYPHIGAFASEVPLARSAGICICHAGHNPDSWQPLVSSNRGLSVVSAVSGGNDIAAAAATAALTPKPRAAIPLLPPFVGIVKMTGAAYPHPFLAQWQPPADIRPLSEDERLATNARILTALPSLLPGHPRSTPAAALLEDQSESQDLLILKDLDARPFVAVTERAAGLRLADGKPCDCEQLTRWLAKLRQQNLCQPVTVRMAQSRGGDSFYWILTENGYHAIRVPVPLSRGGTGIKHAWAQRFVQHLLAGRGIAADIEPKKADTEVDLGFTDAHTSRTVALELVLSTHAYEYAKLARTLAVWDRALIVCLTADDRKLVEKHLCEGFKRNNQMPDSRVTLCYPAHLLEKDISRVYDCPELVFKPFRKAQP